jgi:hypothetical protein
VVKEEKRVQDPRRCLRNPDFALQQRAEKQHDQLTNDQRALLRSRGDVIGKALADLDSLTVEKVHEAMG